MKDIKHIHRQAMEQSDLALRARTRGDAPAAAAHVESAYELEAQAASSLLNDLDAEPTRSVLFRSAATLARDCGRFAEAEKLIYKALAGEPPAEIADELQDLLEQVNFHRHLELRGVSLGEAEMQMSIAGKAVGFGVAPTDIFLERVRSTESLVFRTAERKGGRQYRDRGPIDAQLMQNLEFYMSVPRAASFAVTFRVGASLQQSLPGLSLGEEVIDELLDCMQLYTEGNETRLRERISEEAYYRNFVGLARTLEPDGAKVNIVGFTTIRRGATRQVAMTQPVRETATISPSNAFATERGKTGPGENLVELRGELLLADATKKSGKQSGEIEIVTSGNVRVKVVVPPGMMSDIVKPLWETEVEVTGARRGKKIHLLQIKAAS